jgi:hypothetical protein
MPLSFMINLYVILLYLINEISVLFSIKRMEYTIILEMNMIVEMIVLAGVDSVDCHSL